jgi:hypothetical protein
MKIKTMLDSLDYFDPLSDKDRDALWRARRILYTLARTHGLTGDDDEGLLFRMAMGKHDEDQNRKVR